MKVEITVSSLATLPAVEGPHELAWSYLLDAVFADAYHAGLSVLRLSLPSGALREEAELRAGLSPGATKEGGDADGIALLGHEQQLPAGVRRTYILSFGVLAPRALRSLRRAKVQGWRLEGRLNVYSLGARLYGAPIRVAGFLKRPDLADRAMFAMRRDFADGGRTPAFYHLSTWSRP